MTPPTQEERREAVRIARAFVDLDGDTDLAATHSRELWLLARTLLAAKEAFENRLAPVYAAALAAVGIDGRIVNDKLPALRAAVLMAREQEPK